MSTVFGTKDLYSLDYEYLKWLIEYFCLSHKDLKKVIRMVEDMTESYHDPS